ncbi:MAG TPA: aromatic acid exporter family protein [Candidatus Dormibacteraeota bacterium]|jgi:hypothetical protein
MGSALARLSEMVRDRLGGVGLGLRVVKTGLACALAWLLAERLLADTLPVLAPLAALLTMQVTVYRSVTVGLQRAAAVMAGVLLALLAARVLGLHAWSVGLVITAALVVGQALRLGQQSVQVPVSALLVLALSGPSNLYARDRILETLLGGAVAVVVNLVVVPPLFTRSADRRLAGLAEAIAGLLDDMASGLTEGWDPAHAHDWLHRARRLHDPLDESRAAITQAEESVRYNPRRPGGGQTSTHRASLTALEHAAFQVRGIARALADLSASDPEAASRLSPRFGELLGAVATAMRAAAETLGGHPQGVDRLRAALATARDRLAEAEVALHAGAGAESPLWHIHGSLLADATRLLREIDPDTGPHHEAFTRPQHTARG